jgi:hypothetical protein
MSQAHPTRRRWLQFSLGTMLLLVSLVAVFLAWLAWELSYIRDRQTWLSDNPTLARPDAKVDATAEISWARKILGDSIMPMIVAPDGWTDNEIAAAKKLFPESVIVQQKVDPQDASYLMSYPPAASTP